MPSYKQNPAARKVETEEGLKYINSARGPRQHLHVAKEDEEVPTAPSAKLSSTPSAELQAMINRVKELFAERPAWTRRGIQNSLDQSFNLNNLKFALPYAAYMWKSGPWKDSYFRLGVDPRKDSSFGQYQSIFCVHKRLEKNADQVATTSVARMI